MDEPSPRGGGCAGEPPRIRRLEESVVNRIAAGEVIQRPSSAVKELIENSLDAGASSVSVVVKDGGLKLIQVSDDGHGIRFEDLPILCERHTTSKLSAYEDLQTIKSMGFRGEALASMTYVGHVTVENLFYNMVARKKTLQNSNDDYPKIVDFISRFAVHHINVTFSCRKHGANRADVHSASTSSRLDAIRSVYGASVVRDLIEIKVSDEDAADSIFKMDGYISNANYVAKKITMILFINDRLVDCTALKRAIEFVYSATLPQASKPFIYMSINLPSEHVDVNIHPTKKEVSLLNQERIIETIRNAVEEKLMNSNTTRIFQTQALNLSGIAQANPQKDKVSEASMGSGTKSQKIPVSQMIRTDPRNPSGRLHTYWHGQSSNLEKKFDLVSVRLLEMTRKSLLDIVKNCTYVGLADEAFALIQHNTRLYLVNVVNISKELMYQQALCRFGNFNAIQLSESAPLQELLVMALKDDELMSDEKDDEKLEIAEVNTEILKENAEMINEYFSIHIDQDGKLTRLPVVLDQYTPDMDRLPEFVLALGNDVTWDDEKECFRTVAAAIGNFYALHPPILPNPSGNGIQLYKKNRDSMAHEHVENDLISDENDVDQELLAEAEAAWAQREWTIQHVLFPSMRLFLKPPKSMATDGTFVQVGPGEAWPRVDKQLISHLAISSLRRPPDQNPSPQTRASVASAAGDDGEAAPRSLRLALLLGILLSLAVPLRLLGLRLFPVALSLPLLLVVVVPFTEPLPTRCQGQALNLSGIAQANPQKDKVSEASMGSGTKSQKIPVSQMVRTDPRNPSGRLHTYWHGQSSNLEKKFDLVSVRSRRNQKDAGLLDIVKNCAYVGLADEAFALIQHNTRLYLVNVVNIRMEGDGDRRTRPAGTAETATGAGRAAAV
uniref:DNA mismatch repair protein S5 domain-containing protein n=2 Tax=Oryza glumipatula TaxID=40148 RepID=A0A0D9YK94_9ORYZ